MFTHHSRSNVLRRIILLCGVGSLVLCGLAAVSPAASAKEKFSIDPVTGTKYKPDSDMQELLVALAALGGKPIGTLTPTDARSQPTMADAINAVLKKRGLDTDPGKLVPDVTTTDATIPAGDGAQLTATVYTPTGPGPFPAVVYFHGGGWVIGSRQVCDLAARTLAKEADVVVISVDYRLDRSTNFRRLGTMRSRLTNGQRPRWARGGATRGDWRWPAKVRAARLPSRRQYRQWPRVSPDQEPSSPSIRWWKPARRRSPTLTAPMRSR